MQNGRGEDEETFNIQRNPAYTEFMVDGSSLNVNCWDMTELSITETRRLQSPAVTPQALAWHDGALWMGSRDLRRIYKIDSKTWTVVQELEPPGIPWAAVSLGEVLRFTVGQGPDDD